MKQNDLKKAFLVLCLKNIPTKTIFHLLATHSSFTIVSNHLFDSTPPTRKTLRHENIDFRDVETIVYK